MIKIEDMLLYYTHIHIDGVSEKKEKANWAKNLKSLNDLGNVEARQLTIFSENKNIYLQSIEDLKNQNLIPFIKNLPRSEYYRIAFSFPEKVMFLDIETTGLSKVYSYTTVLGWYIDSKYKYALYGNSLDDFIVDLAKAELIVTFNGSLFDVPFISYQYEHIGELLKTKAHIDLRFLCKKYGYTGGQKSIEHKLNFKRPNSLKETDGKEAISLWYKFLSGHKKSLELLLYYNCYDILGMVFLLNTIFFKHIYGKEFPKYGKPMNFKRKYKTEYVKLNTEQMNIARDSVKNNITFFRHEMLMDSYNYSVVGIDLTGSEDKASGVALMKGNKVKTSLIFSDDELVDYVVRNKVDLVSIDSPLSMPAGRTSVFDDDPERYNVGIMRDCERKLKKRGVNAYPALIPSMQKLTKRGIDLADRFRKLGIAVIESFPGAAQDVLQIPRKRTDIHFLKKGLIEFGLTGSFIKKKITHDELDAITSALVGQFYISNYYDELGNEKENYLIIPHIYEKKLQTNKCIIGVCGPIATGKTELSRYIEKQGYRYIRYSEVIQDYLKEIDPKLEANRTNLQIWGQKIFSEYGQYWLNKRLFKVIKDEQFIVVDGLRHPEDIAFLREHFYNTFVSVYIDSEYSVREQRYQLINKESYKDVSEHTVEQNINHLKKLADYIIFNNSSKEDLYEAFNTVNNKRV